MELSTSFFGSGRLCGIFQGGGVDHLNILNYGSYVVGEVMGPGTGTEGSLVWSPG